MRLRLLPVCVPDVLRRCMQRVRNGRGSIVSSSCLQRPTVLRFPTDFYQDMVPERFCCTGMREKPLADTLLRNVGGIVLLQNRRTDGIGLTDTLSIEIEGHTFKFAWQPPAQERYEEMIAEIEKAHGYENPGSETY